MGAYTLGCLFGAIPTIFIGNILGRRKTIFLGSSIMIIGATLQCTPFGLPQLIVARFVTGVGRSPHRKQRKPRRLRADRSQVMA